MATIAQLREAARLICCAADAAYMATLRGDVPAGSSENFKPVIGHYVMETGTFGMSASEKMPHLGDPLNNVGMLESITQEPVFTQEQWDEGGDGPDVPIPTETVYNLRLLDGRKFSWRNASMIRVPDSRNFKVMKSRQI